MNQLYQYLTKQTTSQDSKEELYDNYITIINTCYFPNLAEMSIPKIEDAYIMMDILLDTEYASPSSFIILNDRKHYLKMKTVINFLMIQTLDQDILEYLSQEEFDQIIILYRKQFSNMAINSETLEKNVSKYPKKERIRFGRKV